MEVEARAFDYDEMTVLLSVKDKSIEADKEERGCAAVGGRSREEVVVVCRRRCLGEGMWLFGGVSESRPGEGGHCEY